MNKVVATEQIENQLRKIKVLKWQRESISIKKLWSSSFEWIQVIENFSSLQPSFFHNKKIEEKIRSKHPNICFFEKTKLRSFSSSSDIFVHTKNEKEQIVILFCYINQELNMKFWLIYFKV